MERREDDKTENRWMNCWYMTEVGLSSNSRMGKDSSMDHGAIVRGIILLSLSYHVGDKARDPNPKYLRGVLSSRFAPRGREGCLSEYIPPPHLPLLESATTMAGPRGTRRLESPRA